MAIANLAKKRIETSLSLVKPEKKVVAIPKAHLQPRLQIRQARMSDLDAVVQLDHDVWPEECWASREMYEKRFNTFLEGSFVAVDEGSIRGVIVTVMLDYDLKNPIPTWKELSDDGKIEKSHNPNGNSIYGVALSVSPLATRNTALLLVEAAKLLVIKKGLHYGLLGSRIPKFHKHANEISVKDYVFGTTHSGRPLDPEIAFYKKAGFQITKILPNYFEDPESLNYGVLMVWHNLYYGKSSLRRWEKLIRIGIN